LKIPTDMPPTQAMPGSTGGKPAATTPGSTSAGLPETAPPDSSQGSNGGSGASSVPGSSAAPTADTTSTTAAPATSAVATDPSVAGKTQNTQRALTLTAALASILAVALLVLRRKRHVAQLGAESAALKAWRRVEKKLEKDLRSAHEPSMSYRERHVQVGASIHGAALQHRMLAEAVDAALYGPPQSAGKHETDSAELADQVLENMKGKHRE
jgi:hypothetical protein